MNATAADKQWFGHPRGLSTLFFTELWERFSFYGMKAMLFLFVTAAVIEGPQAGLGMGEEQGGALTGLYNSFVYLLALPGGWLADRLIGQRKAVLYGGIIIASGHFSMAATTVNELFFYMGLVLIVIGTGLLKPNVSTMVAELYKDDTGARRDAGFSIFYMGINTGAFVAPILCGALRQWQGWHWAFGLAGFGMTIGVIWYLVDSKYLGTAGIEPVSGPEEQAVAKKHAIAVGVGIVILSLALTYLHRSGTFVLTWTGVADFVGAATLIVVLLFLIYVGFFTGLEKQQTKQVMMIGILFVFTAMFWSGFEQASTSLNAFARDFTDRTLFGFEIPTEVLQAVNPLFIIAFSPVFAAIWIRLAAKNLSPSIPMKFALGLIQLSVGFLVIMVAARVAGGGGVDVSFSGEQPLVMPTWLCLTYLFFSTGELCLSPVGLSTTTKLAPKRFVSQMMGIWFIAAALGNLIAGRVGGLIEDKPHAEIFQIVAMIAGAAGLLLLVISPFCQKHLMGDVR
ncbi:MAG: peptide MFS transporter [Thermoanaerobaculia bacterium]|nr:peptide MFS transporter [Thermoanaerobaculia bacterium]